MAKCKESICLYGPSGVGKTTQAEELASFIRGKMGKDYFVRLVSASGGGWSSILPSVEEGWVRPIFVADRRDCYFLMDRLTKGWWPQNGALIPPEKQLDWDKVGAIFFDSLTEIANWMMRTTVSREAAGEIKTSSEGLSVAFKDGTERYGTPGRAHYGTVQNNLEAFVAQSKAFFPERYVVWTALELKATDDNTRTPVYGPDIIGKAKTAQSGAWFDDLLHLHFQQLDPQKPPTRKMFASTHFAEDGVPFMAKNRSHRLAPMKQILEGEEFSIAKFLEEMELSQQRAKVLLKNGTERI